MSSRAEAGGRAEARGVVLIPGDGIGPEVTESALAVLEALGARLDWEPVEAGADVLAKYGTVVPDGVLNAVQRSGVALKGPITTPSAMASRAPTCCCASPWTSTPACGP
jgi:isocitrate dehydrogenase (NAD+)